MKKRKRQAPPPLPPILTLAEETSLLKLLREQPVTTARVARLRRKLALREVPHTFALDHMSNSYLFSFIHRKIKRTKSIPQFDLDQIISSVVFHLPKQNQRLAALDEKETKEEVFASSFNISPTAVAAEKREYIKPETVKQGKDKEKEKENEGTDKEIVRKKRKWEITYFRERLMGQQQPVKETISPFTCRNLLPFIRRDYESRPVRVQLYEELYAYHDQKKKEQRKGQRRRSRSRGEDDDESPRKIAPIDYTYLRPSLVASVNRFLCELFWPDIDGKVSYFVGRRIRY